MDPISLAAALIVVATPGPKPPGLQIFQTETAVVEKVEKQEIEVKQLSVKEKIEQNFYKCDETTEWIRADNAKCLPKPVVKAAPTPEHRESRKSRESYVKQSPSVPVSSPGNTYSRGYCTWWVKSQRPDIPNGLGNANTWYSRAASLGMAVGSSPRVGAVATTTRGAYGHVSLVLKVEGGRILVSEMNTKGWNVSSTGWYPSSDYVYIY